MGEGKLFTIRKFRLEDLDAVRRINKVFLPENYPEYFFRSLYNNCPDGFLVAIVEDKVIGYIMCRLEVSYSLFKKIKWAHIVSIAVDERYRRKGVGTALIKGVIKNLADKVDGFYLEVRVSNKPAINLYEKMGFEITKRISKYYMDGEDAYLMTKWVSKGEKHVPFTYLV